MNGPTSSIPRLLVSVRSSVEAMAALDGGVDILDVKEPSHGALGMATTATIREVVGTARIVAIAGALDDLPPSCPVSAAMGELSDWPGSADVPSLPAMSYAKLGLAGMSRERDWIGRWQNVRGRFERAADDSFQWIAVAYADWKTVGAPEPAAVIDAAIRTECAGVLFDTCSKSGGGLFEYLPADDLRRFIQELRTRDEALLIAVGGSLTVADLPQVAEVAPDIVAIRTSACMRGERGGMVTANAIARFRENLVEAFGG